MNINFGRSGTPKIWMQPEEVPECTLLYSNTPPRASTATRVRLQSRSESGGVTMSEFWSFNRFSSHVSPKFDQQIEPYPLLLEPQCLKFSGYGFWIILSAPVKSSSRDISFDTPQPIGGMHEWPSGLFLKVSGQKAKFPRKWILMLESWSWALHIEFDTHQPIWGMACCGSEPWKFRAEWFGAWIA